MLPTLWELIQKILSLYRFVRKVEQVESWSLFVVECHCCRQYSSEESRSGTWSKFQKKKMKCFTSFPFSQDIILSNSHSYNACNNAIESAIKRCNADTLSLDLRWITQQLFNPAYFLILHTFQFYRTCHFKIINHYFAQVPHPQWGGDCGAGWW